MKRACSIQILLVPILRETRINIRIPSRLNKSNYIQMKRAWQEITQKEMYKLCEFHTG
jgi:hypothetical protein